MKTSILLVDEHEIVYSGIELLFTVENNHFDLSYAPDGTECKELLKTRSFDLIILDVNIPNTDSIKLLIDILALYPNQKVLVYSMSSEDVYAKRLLKLGAMGYLCKSSSNHEFIKAVNEILKGKKYISESLKDAIAYEVIYDTKSENVFDRLSPREFEIMSLFLKGFTSKEISNMTNLHSSTIGTYKTKIFEKLRVSSIIELNELSNAYDIR